MENSKKRTFKKRTTGLISLILVISLLLAGTFAWNIAKKALNEFSNQEECKNPDVLLHDDFDPNNAFENKDVYVENTGDTDIYVRVMLQEYMSLTSSERPQNIGDLWKTHKPTVEAGDVQVQYDDCENENTAGEEFHDYFTWTWGGTKIFKTGQPAFTDPDLGATYQYARDNEDYGTDPNPVAPLKWTLGGADHASPISGLNVILRDEWLKFNEDQRLNYQGWIYDSDGWAYWSQPLAPGEATGLLIDKVDVVESLKDKTFYYAINVLMEAIDEDDKDQSMWYPNWATLQHTITPLSAELPGEEGADAAVAHAPATEKMLPVLAWIFGVRRSNVVTVTGLVVVEQPTKKVYYDGESFNPAGMVLEATYSNGTKETINGDDPRLTFEPDPLTAGDTEVTVWFEGESASVKIELDEPVKDARPVSIKITKQPTKRAGYRAGESFDPTGMEVEVTYSNGDKKTIYADDPNLSFKPEPLTEGTNVVEVWYCELKDEVGIALTEPVGPAGVESIVVTKPPSGDFDAGDTFDPDGMEITVTWTDGTTEVIPSDKFGEKGVTIDAPTPLEEGNNTITIEYKDGEVDYVVNAGAATPDPVITGISIKTQAKTTYTSGQPFNPTGLVITATKSDGSTQDIPYAGNASDFSFSPSGNLVMADESVTVTYKGFTAPHDVTVGYALLDTDKDSFAPDPANPEEFSIYINSAVCVEAFGDVVYDPQQPSIEHAYGLIPLSYFFEDPLFDTSKVSVHKVNGLPAGTGTITTGKGMDYEASRLSGLNYSGQDCLVIEFLPSNFAGYPTIASERYYNVTIQLRVGESVTENISIRLIFAGFIA